MGLTTNPEQASLYAYSNRIIGTIFGLFSAGAIFGALFVGWLCDRNGRKPTLVLAAVINIIGGALQTGSVHVGMFIAARFITGFAGGQKTFHHHARLLEAYFEISHVRYLSPYIYC